jgi:hypothetical protein
VNLVNMAEEQEYGIPITAPTPNPYPYGLRLNLTQEQLAKLGYDELPPAGTEIRLEAVTTVVRTTSEDPDADGDVDYSSIELQIKELGIEQEGEVAEEDEDEDGEHMAGRADRMYGKREG